MTIPDGAVERGDFRQFLVLLRELLRAVDEPARRTKHERLPLHDMLFIVISKVFFRFSSADHCMFLELLHPDLRVGHIPHRNSVTNYMMMGWLRLILEGLIGRASQPLINFSGVLFAIDGTPLLTPGYYIDVNKEDREEGGKAAVDSTAHGLRSPVRHRHGGAGRFETRSRTEILQGVVRRDSRSGL